MIFNCGQLILIVINTRILCSKYKLRDYGEEDRGKENALMFTKFLDDTTKRVVGYVEKRKLTENRMKVPRTARKKSEKKSMNLKELLDKPVENVPCNISRKKLRLLIDKPAEDVPCINQVKKLRKLIDKPVKDVPCTNRLKKLRKLIDAPVDPHCPPTAKQLRKELDRPIEGFSSRSYLPLAKQLDKPIEDVQSEATFRRRKINTSDVTGRNSHSRILVDVPVETVSHEKRTVRQNDFGGFKLINDWEQNLAEKPSTGENPISHLSTASSSRKNVPTLISPERRAKRYKTVDAKGYSKVLDNNNTVKKMRPLEMNETLANSIWGSIFDRINGKIFKTSVESAAKSIDEASEEESWLSKIRKINWNMN